jgi:hypothetical protein
LAEQKSINWALGDDAETGEHLALFKETWLKLALNKEEYEASISVPAVYLKDMYPRIYNLGPYAEVWLKLLTRIAEFLEEKPREELEEFYEALNRAYKNSPLTLDGWEQIKNVLINSDRFHNIEPTNWNLPEEFKTALRRVSSAVNATTDSIGYEQVYTVELSLEEFNTTVLIYDLFSEHHSTGWDTLQSRHKTFISQYLK